MTGKLALSILLIILVVTAAVVAAPLGNNLGFELGTWRETAYYIQGDPTLYHTEFGEISPAQDWVSWWLEDFDSVQGLPTGRPEVKVIDLGTGFPDEERVQAGNKALQAFTFYRPHNQGIAQRFCYSPDSCYTLYVRSIATHGLKHADLYVDSAAVEMTAGMIRLSAYLHAWYSDCDFGPHLPYPEYRDRLGFCQEIDWAHQYLYLGIDPAGGEVDPLSETIIWHGPWEQYGTYADEPFAIEFWRYKSYFPFFPK